MTKKTTLSYLAISLLSAIGVSCDNSVVEESTRLDFSKMTAFAAMERSDTYPMTRTSGEYVGTGMKFYWSTNDQLWVNNTAVANSLVESSASTIPTVDAKEEYAKFWMADTYTAPSYPVRYTGTGNRRGDRVTIKPEQTQALPNDGTQLGMSGDCGTATAVYDEASRSYRFMLDHKASYLTFMPYYSPGFTSDVKVTQIKVSANEPLAGVYAFDDQGLDLSTVTTPSKSITLTLAGGGTNGFILPPQADYTQNGAIMVLAPGRYTDFTVEYTLYDQVTRVGGTVSKNYGTITCAVGKNKRVAADLDVMCRGGELHLWDAQLPFWHGVSDYPVVSNASNANYPKNASDPRWHNTMHNGANKTFVATRSCKDAPNINEMCWYAQRGKPYWDPNKLWSMYKHLYKSGVWLLKRDNIEGYTATNAPNGTNYLLKAFGINSVVITEKGAYAGTGQPAHVENYFFLPCEGDLSALSNGSGGKHFNLGEAGAYWTSTGFYSSTNQYYGVRLTFSRSWIDVRFLSGAALGCSIGDFQ